MNTHHKPLLIASTLLVGMLSGQALAYGPRDVMTYRHPTVMPSKSACESRIAAPATHHPRRVSNLHLCVSAQEPGRHELRIANKGPRPRAMSQKKPRLGARLARR